MLLLRMKKENNMEYESDKRIFFINGSIFMIRYTMDENNKLYHGWVEDRLEGNKWIQYKLRKELPNMPLSEEEIIASNQRLVRRGCKHEWSPVVVKNNWLGILLFWEKNSRIRDLYKCCKCNATGDSGGIPEGHVTYHDIIPD